MSKEETEKANKNAVESIKEDIKGLYNEINKLNDKKRYMINSIEFDIRANTIHMDKLRVELDQLALNNNILAARLAELQK